MSKDAPVHEVTDETSQASDTLTLDLVERHCDVLSGNLLGSEMSCLIDLAGCARFTYR